MADNPSVAGLAVSYSTLGSGSTTPTTPTTPITPDLSRVDTYSVSSTSEEVLDYSFPFHRGVRVGGDEGEQESKTSSLDQSKPPTPNGKGHPENFRVIATGLYRSSYPTEPNFEALKQLNLKTIITLVKEDELAGPPSARFRQENGIQWRHSILSPNKPNDDPKKRKEMNPVSVCRIVHIMMNKRYHPLLIHCNKGKHRSGCVTAIYRRVDGWTTKDAIAEYDRFAGDKSREADRKFIADFDMDLFESMKGDIPLGERETRRMVYG